MKKVNQLEYIAKGFSNKRRIEIVILLDKKPETTVGEIAKMINLSFTSTSHHLLKMMATGIVMKRNAGLKVRHALTEKGKIVLEFLSKL